MKTLTCTLTLLFLAANILTAEVFVVDNSDNATAPYSSFQAAVDDAAAGDTIMLQPSPYSYGNDDIQIPLVIIGPGHNPGFTSERATVNRLTLHTAGSGSVFIGLHIIDGINCNSYNQVDEITIKNCLFHNAQISGGGNGCCGSSGDSDNWIIEGNVFFTDNRHQMISLGVAKSSGWMVYNNLFILEKSGGYPYTNYLFDRFDESCLIANNTILFDLPIDNGIFRNSNDVDFRNNVIYGTDKGYTDIDYDCSNCLFTNNITYNTDTSFNTLSGTGNLDNTNPDLIDVPNVRFRYSYNYGVSNSSPAHNAGTDGTDMGITGGGGYFNLNGFSASQPRMESLFIYNRIVPKGDTVKVQFKAKRGGLK